ncbi:MAG: hypothetical protein R2860_11710 [Desulfobacterales bacterium]
MLSGFGDDVRRTTAAQCILRNDMVAALADAIPGAPRRWKRENLTTVRKALAYGRKIVTFEDDANADPRYPAPRHAAVNILIIFLNDNTP